MRILVSFAALALFGLGVLTACNSAEHSAQTPTGPSKAPAAAPQAADGVRRVTINELQALIVQNKAIVIDVRNQQAYDSGHIRSSRLIPEAEVASHSAELPKDKLIVTYCS